MMEVGEELGRRGHQVTVVSPQRYKTVPPNVTDIVIESEFEALSNRMTTDLVANDKPSSPPFLEVTHNNTLRNIFTDKVGPKQKNTKAI